MRVLLSDGSGLTARQTASLLSAGGHRVEVLSADPLCLCRWTGHVRAVRRVPAYGGDPMRWLEAALAIYRDGGFDVLLPTQEQVAVLAAFPNRLRAAGVNTVVPTFAALSAVLDKIAAWRTLSRLGIPQPIGAVGVQGWDRYPAFVKQAIGTASQGVRRITGPEGLQAAGDSDPVLVQAAAEGPLAMCQAVFDHGRPVAFHAALRVGEGANGAASHKRRIDLPAARSALDHLGRALGWHGALAADVIVAAGGPLFIDINPRLVEPVNAALSGVDLVGPMLRLARGAVLTAEPTGVLERPRPAGTATHQLLLAVLGAAAADRGRRAVVGEFLRAARRTGPYAGSTEELTPLRGDLRSAVPLVAAGVATLLRPASWSAFTTGGVAHYALTPAGWDQIRAHAEPFTAASGAPCRPSGGSSAAGGQGAG